MVSIKISINDPQLEYLHHRLKTAAEGVFPKTEDAMAEGAKKIQSVWQYYALGKKRLPGVSELKNPSRKYAESIRIERTGVFEYEIYSDAKIAEWIENGTKELDMKKTHPYGPRSRVSKKTGYPYLIVPFQWGTEEGTARSGPKNIVPKQLLSLMLSSRFKASTVRNNTRQSPNARGEMVDRNTYAWGDRARGSDFTGSIEKKSYASGMVRFEQGEAAEKTGGDRHGGYFTFRIISAAPWAKGWIKPAVPGHHVTRGLKEYMEDEISLMAEEAMREDFGL
jgi:hypothetical protein